MNIDFSNLEKQGYVVIPNFLSIEEIDMFITDKNTSTRLFNSFHSIPMPSKTILEKISPKVLDLMNQIGDNTSIKTNVISMLSLYMDTSNFQMPWHQDHVSWYIDQHHDNYLNFYISIIKPNSNLSGLSLIPYDVIDKNFPEHKEKFLGKGAKRFFPNNNKTTVFDDETGEEYDLPINIDNVQVSPKINPGDALILRGDVIHKTQDTLTNRLSVTIRCLDGDFVVSKKKMLSTECKTKSSILTSNLDLYRAVINAYGDKETMTIFELYEKWN